MSLMNENALLVFSFLTRFIFSRVTFGLNEFFDDFTFIEMSVNKTTDRHLNRDRWEIYGTVKIIFIPSEPNLRWEPYI